MQWIGCVYSVTHHASRLHSLRHIPGIGLAPEDVAVEAMAAGVHDEGEGVHVPPDAHERQESDATLDQHVLFVLVIDQESWKCRL